MDNLNATCSDSLNYLSTVPLMSDWLLMAPKRPIIYHFEKERSFYILWNFSATCQIWLVNRIFTSIYSINFWINIKLTLYKLHCKTNKLNRTFNKVLPLPSTNHSLFISLREMIRDNLILNNKKKSWIWFKPHLWKQAHLSTIRVKPEENIINGFKPSHGSNLTTLSSQILQFQFYWIS